jgi:hypothetical protein
MGNRPKSFRHGIGLELRVETLPSEPVACPAPVARFRERALRRLARRPARCWVSVMVLSKARELLRRLGRRFRFRCFRS